MKEEKMDLWEKISKFKVSPYNLITGDDDWKELRETLERPISLKVLKI
jgi:hypothetical protein